MYACITKYIEYPFYMPCPLIDPALQIDQTSLTTCTHMQLHFLSLVLLHVVLLSLVYSSAEYRIYFTI